MSKFPDGIFQYGGMPVGGGRYEAMWPSAKVYFVDYDNGTTGAGGKSPSNAFKYLDTAIGVASACDVIYVRPRTPDTAGGDPQAHLPSSSSQYSIASTKHALSIIGTGVGTARRSANQTRLQGYSAATGSVMTVYAPYVNIENITFRRGSSTGAGLLIEGQTTGGSGYAFDVTVNKCGFWKLGATATKGALYIESAWHCYVENSWFEECAKGVGYGVSGSNVVGCNVIGCWFNGVDTTIDADIYATSGSTITEVFIHGCNFAHDIPALSSGNSYNKYIDFATASGLISKCWFGTETETIATNMDRSNCDVVDCWFTNTSNLNPNDD